MPIVALLGFAVVATGLGVVLAGPVTAQSEALQLLPADDFGNQVEPEPAITAPAPTAGTNDFFDAPEIVVVPLPPPPTTGRSGGGNPRITSGSGGGSGGGAPYAGYTAAQYCALKLTPYSTSGSDPTAFLAAANQERAATGAPAMSWNGTLASFASTWSSQMASDQNAHPEWVWGSAEWYAGVFRHSGGPYAENIAVNFGYSNPVNQAQAGWMLSTGHCKNIMNPNYSQFGAGKAQAADGTWYFTEEFSW